MLHSLDRVCESSFVWIVRLQAQLLHAVCQPCTSPVDITPEWVVRQCAAVGAEETWARRLCGRRDTIENLKLTVLKHLETIAGLEDEVKRGIWESFRNNIAFKRGFDPNVQPPFTMHSISDANVLLTVRGLFESFYEPTFGKKYGYKIPDGSDFKDFNRSHFLDDFSAATKNPSKICALCDGDLGTPQVDHWIPKSKYPFLSCHPLNLVPICASCNKSKDDKLPFDLTPTPFDNWFHPYLRTVNREIRVNFRFTPPGNSLKLECPDPQDQAKLDNLNTLPKLQEMWTKELASCVRRTIKKIEDSKVQRTLGICETDKDEDLSVKLKAKIGEWANERRAEIGERSFAILEHQYLQSVERQDPETFDELFIALKSSLHSGHIDPVNGEEAVNGNRTDPLADLWEIALYPLTL